MRYPKHLEDNGTIGFIAPSFGCATEPYGSRYDSAKKKFADMGYKLMEGPNTKASLGIGKSNTPKACGDEINDFFIQRSCDIVMSCGGGETMCEDLPFVDFEGIKKADPKWFIGYSDNANLTFLLPTICDTAAIYGPCVSDFGMTPWHPSIKDAFSILTGEKLAFDNYDGWESGWPDRETNPCAPYNITEPYKQIIITPDMIKTEQTSKETVEKLQKDTLETCFEGRLIGGCLDVLVSLVGTRFDKVKEFDEKYKEDGFIWFLESCDLNSMSIRRALWNLNEAGWFKYLKGFLIGRPLQYQDDFDGFTPYEANIDYLKQFNVPIVYNMDLGHLSPMIPIVSGAYAKVNAKGNEIRIEHILK